MPVLGLSTIDMKGCLIFFDGGFTWFQKVKTN